MQKILRIIDANLNRSQEGLRVCEDIARFALNDKKMTGSFKKLRHFIGASRKKIKKEISTLIKARDTKKDIGKKVTKCESKRKNLKTIFIVNMHRVCESLRVLEEISKLFDKKLALKFKNARFKIYGLEKKSYKKMEALLHN